MPGFKIDTSNDGPANNEETQRVHRWRFGSNMIAGLEDFALSCTPPTLTIDQVTYHQGQNEIYVPAKHKWEPVRLTLYVVQNETLEKIKEWQMKVVETEKNFNNMMWTGNAYRDDFNIYALDGVGEIMRTYVLHGAWPSKIEPKRFDYESSDLNTVEVSITYDYAESREGSGVGGGGEE